MNIKDKIINLIFPINCLYCNKENTYICTNCMNKLLKEIQPNQNYILSYKNHKHLIHLLKYKNIRSLKTNLGILLNEYFKKNIDQNKQYILIPIPLHKKRLKTRGFNQTELILQEAIKYNTNLKINTSLKRIIHTKQQTKLKKESRIKNAKNIFQTNDLSLKNKHIIIFDDVRTTGSTLKSAKEAVKTINPKSIKTISFLK